MLLGHLALRRLAAMKLRAWLRSTRRRLATPAGALFGIIGFGAMGLWIASLFLRTSWIEQPERSGPELFAYTKSGIGLFVLLTSFSSLTHRGLYLPKEEIERLLSAPLARSDLVRYRLGITLGKSLFFSVIMAWFFSQRMPSPVFGFAGALVTLCTLPLVGQAVALLAGDAENRLSRIVKRLPLGTLRILVGLAFWLFLMGFLFADDLARLFPVLFGAQRGARALLAHPIVSALTAPFTPWATAMLATDWRSFWIPFAGISAAWVVLYELVARLPVDFRELSLETSADVARRLNRLRGGRFSLGRARLAKGGFGWHVPWLFGRGPFGAIAWLQSCGIVRKARGTLFFSILMTGLITAFTSMEDGVAREGPIANAGFVAGMTTLYLAWGLRFDFRSSLETMGAIKAWPVQAWKIFAAMLLPEVCLVSLLAGLAVLAQATITDHLEPEILVVIAAAPLVAMLWFALDNAVFLLLPVRYTPGQGGAMQHTGRQMVMVLLRTLAFLIVGGAGVAVGYLAWFLADRAALSPRACMAVGAATGTAFFFAVLAALVRFGGWALRRFDPAQPT